jgi:hypothetical protein
MITGWVLEREVESEVLQRHDLQALFSRMERLRVWCSCAVARSERLDSKRRKIL